MFSSPHGLEEGEHYTTAHDLARLTAYAMKNQTFREIVSTTQKEIRWTTRPYSRVLKNKNKMLKSYQGAEGVKTGFTKRAGRCLVTSACRDDFRVIVLCSTHLICGMILKKFLILHIKITKFSKLPEERLVI